MQVYSLKQIYAIIFLMDNSLRLEHSQVQKQIQKLSQIQIMALNYLTMENSTLRDEIYREVNNNPALEIVREPKASFRRETSFDNVHDRSSYGRSETSDNFQQLLENQESYGETLQDHLLHQLNSMNLSNDEAKLCRSLIYNLDKNGFYGSMLSPETFLSHKNPVAEHELLDRCLKIVQALDPIGTCCRTPEESLLVQARLTENPDPLALFILDGHLDFLTPPEPAKIFRKLSDFQENWHKKAFASRNLDVTIIEVKPEKDKINYFLSVDPDVDKDQNILDISYNNKSIYILHYPKGKNINVSFGLTSGVNQAKIYHLCNTERGSSGSPILSLNTFKVIGVHRGSPVDSKERNNIGTLMKYAIEEFNGKKNNDNIENKSFKINNKLNETTIIYKLGDFDSEVKLFGAEFVKNNEDKCVLIIDGKERKLLENISIIELKSVKKNILKIKLKETEPITNMSYMFHQCSNLIELSDISNWDMSSVTNMKSMFDSCEALSKLSDISKWNTNKVTDMSYMFNYCISLSSIPDISIWNIKSLKNKGDMFLDCKKELNIPNKFK